VTIADRFEAALAAAVEPHLAGPELLPVRLAGACTAVLRVDGAGLSLRDAEHRRVPLGAAPGDAAIAERLQFTVGRGPCVTAEDSGQPVFAVEEDLHRRWPVFASVLIDATPYRAVVALPLQLGVSGPAALDLYFRRSQDVLRLDVFEAMAVGELVGSALNDAAVWSTWSAERGPEWMHGPTPQRRLAVWECVAKVAMELEVDPSVALVLLRARAYAEGVTADEVAADLLAGKRSARDLGP
jgi:hypothetical protein